MTPVLLDYLCEPASKAPLRLENAVTDTAGNIQSADLVAPSGKRYPVVNGVPWFTDMVSGDTVESFGDEWNHFNCVDFKVNWLTHTVTNTFGAPQASKYKIIVDAGGGSGSQSKWFAEYGARHVILMDLSHAVDGVIERNMSGLGNVDVIQCSIDAPPLEDCCIDGIVYCHNVIQHTPSVEKTARARCALTAPGGEFVFKCYPLNDQSLIRWLRHHGVYRPLRALLSRMPFGMIAAYACCMAAARLVPGLGWLLEKSGFCVRGDVPPVAGESGWSCIKRSFKSASLNMYDCFGAHAYQHLKRDEEIRALVHDLQPDDTKVFNMEPYFRRPPPIGCALRVFR